MLRNIRMASFQKSSAQTNNCSHVGEFEFARLWDKQGEFIVKVIVRKRPVLLLYLTTHIGVTVLITQCTPKGIKCLTHRLPIAPIINS